MADFGVFPGRESRIYTVGIEAYSLPVSLVFPISTGGPRDFVVVPDADMAEEFAGAFEGASYSKALGSIYRYVGGGRTELALGDGRSAPASRHRDARFALVRWDRASVLEFPDQVHCLQQLRRGGGDRLVHEIVTATSITATSTAETSTAETSNTETNTAAWPTGGAR